MKSENYYLWLKLTYKREYYPKICWLNTKNFSGKKESELNNDDKFA